MAVKTPSAVLLLYLRPSQTDMGRDLLASLPEFMNFKLFGTILLVNMKFGTFFLGHPLSQ